MNAWEQKMNSTNCIVQKLPLEFDIVLVRNANVTELESQYFDFDDE